MKLVLEKRFWEGFWQLADPKIWVASTIPMLVGFAIVIGSGYEFSSSWFFLALIAIYLIEIGKNAVNEWVDYKSGVDLFVAPENKTPFSGGKKTLIENKLSMKEVVIIAVATLSLALVIGFIIVFMKEANILWIGLIGMALSIFYSLPPFKFAYRGLGEVVVGLTFGPLIVTGVFILMTGTFESWIIPISLPVAFLITNILWINQYPDFEADTQANKRNGLVRIGKKKGVIVYSLFFACTYLSFIAMAIYFSNIIWLLGLLTIPIAIKAVRILGKEYNNIQKLIPANQLTVQIYVLTGVILLVSTIFTF